MSTGVIHHDKYTADMTSLLICLQDPQFTQLELLQMSLKKGWTEPPQGPGNQGGWHACDA